jgi:glycerol uptake facilitator-like aquaporin
VTDDTQQRLFSIVRQVLGIAAAVMGVLTASVSQLHLPPAVSSVLVVVGGLILAVEHYVADPSTGTPVATTTVTTTAPRKVPSLPSADDVVKAQAVLAAAQRGVPQ